MSAWKLCSGTRVFLSSHSTAGEHYTSFSESAIFAKDGRIALLEYPPLGAKGLLRAVFSPEGQASMAGNFSSLSSNSDGTGNSCRVAQNEIRTSPRPPTILNALTRETPNIEIS